MALAAARLGWRHFNDERYQRIVAVHRRQWLKRADVIKDQRGQAFAIDSTEQGIIQAPYSLMPRRIWDIKANRVIDFAALHSLQLADIDRLCHGTPSSSRTSMVPRFWAIAHSWTMDMKPVSTPVNRYEWAMPLPEGIDLDRDLRSELLWLGAEYMWLDVLCLREHAGKSSHDTPRVGDRTNVA